MSKITLITGGTRSGKSRFGESLLKNHDDVSYIATMKITDEEIEERVRLHKLSRNINWNTMEAYKDLNIELSKIKDNYIMFECIGTMITNLIFDYCTDIDNVSKSDIQILEEKIFEEVLKLIKVIRETKKHAIIITNEVGFALVSEYKLGRVFTDILGRVNQRLAEEADEAYLVVCGLPMRIK